MNDYEKLAEAFKDHAESDERNFAEIKADIKEIKLMLRPLTEAYSGVMFSKSFLMGLAGVILAIGAIGTGIFWLINTATNRQ